MSKDKLELDELALKKEQAKEREIELLLLKANESKEESLFFTSDGDIEIRNEIDTILDKPIDNPKEKYELYYNVVRKILRKYLPKGKNNEVARKPIYEEINTYLTRGHRKDKSGCRHADSRMGYSVDYKELVNILSEWAANSRNVYGLYERLRDLNKSKGYGVSDMEK